MRLPNNLFTVPNAVTLGGFLLVITGSTMLDTYLGLGLAIAGRLADLADGYLARKLQQTSKFGATLDLTIDKLAGLAIFIAEWSKGMAPKLALCAIFAQNAANIVAVYLASKAAARGRARTSKVAVTATEILETDQPSDDGKYAMGLQTAAMLGYALGFILTPTYSMAGLVATWLSHICIVLGVGYFGVRATRGYFKRIGT